MKRTTRRIGEKSVQIIYLMRDLYPEHKKHIYNSTIKSRSNFKTGKGHSPKENKTISIQKKSINSNDKEVVLYTYYDG